MAGTINLKMLLNNKGYMNGLSRAKKGTHNFGMSVKAVGAIAATAFAAMGAAMVRSAARMETLNKSFEIMLGTAKEATALTNELMEFAKKTPFSLEDLLGSARQLIAAKGHAEDMTEELRLLGDIASVTAVPIADMAAIYTKAMNKGKLQAREMNQLSERGIPIVAELAKQFGITKEEVFKLGELGKIKFQDFKKALQALTSEGGIAFDAMGRQAKTFAGQVNNLEDNWFKLSVTIGEKVIPTLTGALKGLNDILGGRDSGADEMLLKQVELAAQMRILTEAIEEQELVASGSGSLEALWITLSKPTGEGTLIKLKDQLADVTAEFKKLKAENVAKLAEDIDKVVTDEIGSDPADPVKNKDISIFHDDPQFTKRAKSIKQMKIGHDDLIWGMTQLKIKYKQFTAILPEAEDKVTKFDIAMAKVWEDKAEMIDFAAQSLNRFASIQGAANDNELRHLTAKQDVERATAEGQFASKERLIQLDKKHAKEREILGEKQGARMKKIAISQAILGSAMAQINVWADFDPLAGGFFGRLAKSGIVAGLTGLELAAISGVGFAQGTSYAPPGMKWVGESGRELMSFNGGEKVFSHGRSENMMNNGSGSLMASVSGDEFVVWYKEQARKQNNR